MRSTARLEPDPVDRLILEDEEPATARSTPAPVSGRAARRAPSPGPHALLLANLTAIGVVLAVATYGVEADQESVAIVCLAAAAVLAVAMGVIAQTSIWAGRRTCEALDRALFRSEGAREELRVANEMLQRRNAQLQTLQLAVEDGFDWIDERTQGRLRELVEETGDELAALVDEALDEPTEDAP
jgi:uncharacterized membrane protein YraQ (UPF0718 family)